MVEDVPDDGETVGEVVVRGNIVMKEVSTSRQALLILWDRLCGTTRWLVLEERVRSTRVHSASRLI